MGNANPQSGNPRSYGKIVVTTGGTIVQATNNQTNKSQRIGLQSITVQALPTNTGLIYVRLKGDGADDRTNLNFTIGLVGAPASATSQPPAITITATPASGALNLADIWIDAGVNGNGALISGIAG